MSSDRVFPAPVMALPEADILLAGIKAYLSQGENHQIIFMEFAEDVALPEHCHAAQWGVVLEGRIDLTIGGIGRSYRKGDRYFIPEGVMHSEKIFSGYADITFFAQADRYSAK